MTEGVTSICKEYLPPCDRSAGEGKLRLGKCPHLLSPFAHKDAAGEIPALVEPWVPVPAQTPAWWPFPSLSLHVESETARMEIEGPSRAEILNHHLLQPDVITESRQGGCFDLARG